MKYLKNVEQLALVLVQALYLHVEDRIRADDRAVRALYVLCKARLVVPLYPVQL